METRYEEDRAAYEEEITVLRENLEKMRQLEAEIKKQVTNIHSHLLVCNS